MDAPNPKRPCHGLSFSKLKPNSVPVSHQSQVDSIISALLLFPDSLPSSIASSFERVLDKAVSSGSSDVFVQNRLYHRARQLSLLLHQSTNRCFRKGASLYNSTSWFLPPELTIKVFSMLDTKSLMQAMACCKMFKTCAMDRSSYSHIDLTTAASKVDDKIVCTMIRRAGKALRSLELGHVDHHAKSTVPLRTGRCLAPLSYNHGTIGRCLRSLHLYNTKYLKDKTSIALFSACSNLTDLKIVGIYGPSDRLLQSLAVKCRSIENLFLETHGFPGPSSRESPALAKFLANSPNLTSLTLIGFRLKDATVQSLAQGSRKHKHVNISRNPVMKGLFLRDWEHSLEDRALETLIMRDCFSLKKKEVLQFVDSLLAENFRSIKHIDISNNLGLLSDGGKRCYTPDLPLDKLKKQRPHVKFVANFASALSSSERLSRGLSSPRSDAKDKV